MTLAHRHLTATLALGLALTVAGESQAGQKPGWFRRVFGRLSWEEVATVVDTPARICSAVRHRVSYKKDLGDEWQTGKETWDKTTGDCEDFAAAIMELCRKNGIKAQTFVMHQEGRWEAHAVVVGVWQDRMWVSSNGWYEECDSWADAKNRVAKELRWRNRTGNSIQVARLEADRIGDKITVSSSSLD